MIEFALKNEIRRAAREIFGTTRVGYDVETVYVESAEFYQKLDNSLYFLINETIDVPVTAKVIIQSQSNQLITTKDSYKPLNLRPFRSYLSVKSVNYGEFTPFALNFLKVTPYE